MEFLVGFLLIFIACFLLILLSFVVEDWAKNLIRKRAEKKRIKEK